MHARELLVLSETKCALLIPCFVLQAYTDLDLVARNILSTIK